MPPVNAWHVERSVATFNRRPHTHPCTCLFSCGFQRLWEERRVWGLRSGANLVVSCEQGTLRPHLLRPLVVKSHRRAGRWVGVNASNRKPVF
jgi:transcriptional regulator of acetoin/glycerol metabolism